MAHMPIDLKIRSTRSFGTAYSVLFVMGLFFAGAFILSMIAGASVDDLGLPALAMAGMYAVVIVAFFGATMLSKSWERRSIRQFFENEIWADWRYGPDEWAKIVESRYDIDEKSARYGYLNLIVGPIIGAIIVGVGLFAFPDQQEIKPLTTIIGVVVGFAITALGILLPARKRRQARNTRQRLLDIGTPRIFISRKGFYHEADGYTDFGSLQSVTFKSGSSPRLVFAVLIRVESVSMTSNVELPVPAGREQEAEALLQRFRGN